VPRYDRKLGISKLPVNDVQIRAAHAASPDAEANLPQSGSPVGQLFQLEGPPRFGKDHSSHRSELGYGRNDIGVHTRNFTDRDIFADNEALVLEMKARRVLLIALHIVMEGP
jgi:hypothetical protein